MTPKLDTMQGEDDNLIVLTFFYPPILHFILERVENLS